MSTAPRLTIDLNSLVENWQKLAKLSGNAEASAVVKADAYGLGIEPVAQVLSDNGCRIFFTAMVEEAVKVRKIAPNARVFVLNGVMQESVSTAIEHNLIPVLSSMKQIELWQTSAAGRPSAIHIDTGMNRLGLRSEEAEILAGSNDIIDAINPYLVMSHLACGDEPTDPQNTAQLELFRTVSNLFPSAKKCFANSAGVFLGADFHFDITRPGISIYGGEAVNNVENPMQVVVQAHARILQVRDGKKGEAVGYGAAHRLDKDTKIAICSVGYADGFHRSSSGRGVKLRNDGSAGGMGAVGNHLVPVLGRVSMDLTAFDVSDVPQKVLEDHDWIELFGKTISVDDAARNCGTIGYELLTSLGSRYNREYL